MPPIGDAESQVLTSYEGRWFFAGDLPASVEEVFRAGGGHPEGWPAPRTDRYLPFAPDMGIKLRAEPGAPRRLEFKGRLHATGRVALARHVVAVGSTWSKWSYPVAEVPAAFRDAFREGGTSVPVQKSRILRRFRLDPGVAAREVAPEERLVRGVQLELTRLSLSGPSGETRPGLRAGDHGAWTLGFEGFPLSDGIEAAVHAALASLLAALAAAGARMDEAHSASYPEWLLSPAGRGAEPS